jgi:type II secretory ATPase GspE/PulE/Tfp pilus assembly ATPase PilB-like protein
MCPDHYAVVSSVALVLNQRLIRRVCGACAGAGCEKCLDTGYRGRAPVVEWFRLDDKLRQELRARGPEIIQPAQTLEAAARALVGAGVSNEGEFQRLFGA